MLEPILDTVVLRVLAFAHPLGLDILLETLNVNRLRFPAEVYNQDEASLPLDVSDESLSELARGLRYAQQRVLNLPTISATRYQTWLTNAGQLPGHLERGSLVVDPLILDELPRREALQTQYGIGRGEAACLVLAERYQSIAVFLSSDTAACQVAQTLGIAYQTLPEVIELWVDRRSPAVELFDDLVGGMRDARFGLSASFVARLRLLLS